MGFKGDDSKFSIAATVTLALAVAAMVLVKEPLKSSRPTGLGTEMNGISQDLKARARLWEDPFAAVHRDLELRKKTETAVSARGTVTSAGDAKTRSAAVELTITPAAKTKEKEGADQRQAATEGRTAGGKTVTALIVMTAGGPYANDVEARIGDRYAVEAALDAGCMAPESTEFLRYFTWQFKERADAAPSDVATPYEWYSRNRTAYCPDLSGTSDRVLILWVKADDYKGRILQGLDHLIQHVPFIIREQVPVVFKVVGPRNSSELEGILREIEQRRQAKPASRYSWSTSGQLQVYSPWATAMPGLLSYGMRGKEGAACDSYQECKEAFAYLLAEADLRLAYHIDSDMVLFEELFRELDRRQITIGDDPIVLIGEWDSFYARALPVTFSAAACQYITDPHTPRLRTPSAELVKKLDGKCATSEDGVNALMKGELSPQDLSITRYSYLSGLDGESLEDQQKKAKSKEEDKEKASGGRFNFRNGALHEKPEGTSQLDYVRRLVSRIKSEERNRSISEHKQVKAIGILGRDAYDALLILQAMREEFPTSLFFAVDLYARYGHDSEQKWARNLLVASHFGLQLEGELQQSIPPFRNSYQTSTFFAAQRAIERVKVGATRQQCDGVLATCYTLQRINRETVYYSDEASPRLFEIGRHGVVDLSVTPVPNAIKVLHPARDDVRPGGKTVQLPPAMWRLWILALAVFVVMMWCYERLWNWLSVGEEIDTRIRATMRQFRAALVVFFVLGVLGLWGGVQAFDYDEDEPFSWSDGVSVWPTELLRLFAGLLALWFLIKARLDLVENTGQLTDRFFLALRSAPPVPGHGFWSNLDWMVHGSRRGETIAAADLWARYCEAHSWRQRAGRVFLLFLLYFAIVWSVWPLLNDGQWSLFVPCRGAVSCRLDAIALAISVSSLIVLNLSVLDAVLLATRWTSELARASGLDARSLMRLIVDRTRVVNRRILYPFIVLFIVIGSRSHYFDNWDFPPALIVVLTAHSSVALTSASMLYMAAMRARKQVIDDLESSPRPIGPPGMVQGRRSDRVRKVIEDISSIQQGAFVPFYQQPVVQATLVAALAFLQYWFLGQ